MLSKTPLIERLIILNHAHFGHCDIPFAKLGGDAESLHEICLIGGNGGGKSLLLAHLYDAIQSRNPNSPCSFKLTKLRTDEGGFYRMQECDPAARVEPTSCAWFRDSIELDMSWGELPGQKLSAADFTETFQEHLCTGKEDSPFPSFPPEIMTAFLSPRGSEVNGQPAPSLAEFVADRIRERDAEFAEYLSLSENRGKTVEEAEQNYSDSSTNGLHVLHSIWNSILSQASLQFDLHKRGRILSKATGAEVPIASLNEGLTRYLASIGQVFHQYFRKPELSGFLFIDEPEAGLHPELQCHLVKILRSILSGHQIQLIVATQSPFIATQFSPSSRVLLDFSNGKELKSRRGRSPQGAGPSEILRSDFGMKSLFPQSQTSRRGRATELRKAIRKTDDQDELADLLDELMSLRGFS